MDLDELIDKAKELIDALPENLAAKLKAFLEKWIQFMLVLQGMPLFFREVAAKVFAKNLLALMKKIGRDGAPMRAAVAKWTIDLFDLPDDWDAPFDSEPPEGTSAVL